MHAPRLSVVADEVSDPSRALVLVLGYLSQNETEPEDLGKWISGFRRAGWRGRILHLWWDASDVGGLVKSFGVGHWGKVCDRAERVGRVHAPPLLEEVSEAELTLVGFSLGARVVYSALVARSPRRIRDAILIGGAIDRDHKPPQRDWVTAASAVQHRLLTIGNREDVVLKQLYQRRNTIVFRGTSPVGRKPIEIGHPNIDHFDATDLIDDDSHWAYRKHLPAMPFARWWRESTFA